MIRRSLFLLILSYLCGVLISFRWGALAFSVDFFVLCGAIASGVFFVLSLIQSRTPKEEEDSTNNFAAVSLKGAYLTLMVTILMFGVQRDQERQQREVVAREAVQLVDDLVRRGDSVVWWLEGRLANYPDKIVGNRIRLVLHDIALIWQLPPGAGEPSLTLGTPTIRRANIPGRMQLTVLRDVWQQETGGTLPKPETVIEFSGRVVAPMTATTPGAFDEASFYRARNVTLLADVNLSHQITLQQIPTQQLPIQQILLAQIKMILWQWRAKGFELFERSIGGTDARATVQAMCLGHTQWRRPELRDAFFQTGTLHLFALSGLHAGMIALLVYYLARLAGMNLRQSAWITLVLLSLFVGVAGMRPSLIRATVMTFFLLAPRLLNTSSSPLYALAMSAALLLLLRPATVYDPGFYLSFGSVGGILFLYQSIYVSLLRGSGNTEDLLQSWVRRLVHRWVLQPVAVYWALMVGILPLLLLYYQHAPITGGLANLVAVPMASVTVAMGFLALLVNIVFPALAGLLADAAGSLAALLNAWIEWAAGWPLVGIDVAPAPLAAVILYYPLVFYRLLPLQRFRHRGGLVDSVSNF
jgi:competence protein ComEC